MLHRNDIPPAAVMVAEPPGQIAGTGHVITHVGDGFTVTVVEHELVHPNGSVTVTVYVVVDAGFTVIESFVEPVLQRKAVPPDATSVVEPPMQMDGLTGVMLQMGVGFTITVTEQEEVHPLSPSVTVTVYVVVTAGLTVIVAVVAPVLHRNDVPPDAVSVFEPPGQIDKLPHTMLHIGSIVSWLTTTSAKQVLAGLTGSVTVKR